MAIGADRTTPAAGRSGNVRASAASCGGRCRGSRRPAPRSGLHSMPAGSLPAVSSPAPRRPPPVSASAPPWLPMSLRCSARKAHISLVLTSGHIMCSLHWGPGRLDRSNSVRLHSAVPRHTRSDRRRAPMDPRPASRIVLFLASLLFVTPAAGEPTGTMSFGVHVTLATRWLDPAETDPEITPFMIYYALHDALVKPMPGNLNAPSLAESWTMSKDGRMWEFVLRKGVRFHNGEPVTSEDVKFSFERYKGTGAALFKERVREVEIVDAGRVRFHLKEPWPDFMTF